MSETNESVGEISPYLLMTQVLERLRMLNYTAALPSLPPLSMVSFTTPQNKMEQFKTFVSIVSWLLRDFLNVKIREFDIYMEDPLSVVTELVDALKSFDLALPSEHLSPLNLRTGCGPSVLHVLFATLDLVFAQHNIQFYPTQYPKNIEYVDDDENVEDDDENNIIDDTYGLNQYEEEDDEYTALYSEAHLGVGRTTEEEEADEDQVDPEEWAMELEQVESQLIVKLQPDHKDWRYHVDAMIQKHSSISQHSDSTVKSLQKLSDEIGKVVERIKKREAMLAQDHSLHSLLQQYKNNQDKLEKVTKTYKESEEAISKLSNELNAINQELSEMKQRVNELSKQKGDPASLHEIKLAQQNIKKEIREMDLRAGVLQHKLLIAKQKSIRAMSAENALASRNAA